MLTRPHSRFPISSIGLWLNCAGWASLNERGDTRPESTKAMKEGTEAHEIVAAGLKHFLHGEGTFEDGVEKVLKYYPNTMGNYRRYYTMYFNYIESILNKDPEARVLVEQRVYISLVSTELYGTSDVIILGTDCMHIIDFKFGANVEVIKPTQLKGYALSAIHATEEYDTVYSHVVQPRLSKNRPTIKTWKFTKRELHLFAEKVKDAIASAKRLGTLNPGEHCTSGFCNARSICPAYNEHFNQLLDGESAMLDVKSLTDAELRSMFLKGRAFEARFKSLGNYIKALITKDPRRKSSIGFKLIKKDHGKSFKKEAYSFEKLINNGEAWVLKAPTKLVSEGIITKEELEKITESKKITQMIDIGISKT